jgi:hypothetical protein
MLQAGTGPPLHALRQSSSPRRSHRRVEESSYSEISESSSGRTTKCAARRWRRFNADGSSLDFRDLAGLLKEYDISPQDVWIDGASAKGYTANDLRDAWERYVHPSTVREDREVREGSNGTG